MTVTEPSIVHRRALRVRRGAAQVIELVGLFLVVVGVDRLAGYGVALIVAGVLAVLVAYGVDR